MKRGARKGAWQLHRWHHAAMTYDGSTLRVYVDGKPVAETSVGKQRTTGSGVLMMTRRADGFHHFRGALDEVLHLRSSPVAVRDCPTRQGRRAVGAGFGCRAWRAIGVSTKSPSHRRRPRPSIQSRPGNSLSKAARSGNPVKLVTITPEYEQEG